VTNAGPHSGYATETGGEYVIPTAQKIARGESVDPVQWDDDSQMRPSKLTKYKVYICRFMCQMMDSIGAVVVEVLGQMCSPYLKKSPGGKAFTADHARTTAKWAQ